MAILVDPNSDTERSWLEQTCARIGDMDGGMMPLYLIGVPAVVVCGVVAMRLAGWW